jgi:Mlc titration factor MtfA (ptsG expression regulator)
MYITTLAHLFNALVLFYKYHYLQAYSTILVFNSDYVLDHAATHTIQITVIQNHQIPKKM